MALLGRFVLFIARLTFNFLVWLFVRLLRLLLPVIRTLLVWLLRLVTTAIVASATGPREYIERMASEWTRRLITLGVSGDHLDSAYRLCHLLAASTIVLGWIIVLLFSVAVIRVVFGYFI